MTAMNWLLCTPITQPGSNHGSRNRTRSGFSLNELLLVLLLLGIVATFFIPKVLRSVGDRQWEAEYYVAAQKVAEFLNDAKEYYGMPRQKVGPHRLNTVDTSMYFGPPLYSPYLEPAPETTDAVAMLVQANPFKRLDVTIGDPFNNAFPAVAKIDYGADNATGVWQVPNVCYTDIGNYTYRFKDGTYLANVSPDWPYLDNNVNPPDCSWVGCIMDFDGTNLKHWGVVYSRRRTTFFRLNNQTWPVGVSQALGCAPSAPCDPSPSCSTGNCCNI